ncbi:hypothetical protein ACIP93_15350 [Streptomyces sp. NPDC088745]|uniref:hypothetical protein n=1 Tax=Streptomyces sp. NPDC088745 TaxID=3365884 RepID=UPI00381AAACA
MADLTEHIRLLSGVHGTLKELSAEARQIREGEIAKPVREITPLSLRVHELALQCTRQVHDLSVSEYAATEGGTEALALLVGASYQVSLAGTLCNLATHLRTEIYLYEDADPTAASSADQLRRAEDEMQRAATTYRTVARLASRHLASFTTPSAQHRSPAQTAPNPPELTTRRRA